MKSFELVFKSSDHRIKMLRLKYANTDLSADEVTALMTQMAATNLFAKQDLLLYATPVRATLVETNKTDLKPTTPAPETPEPAPAA